MPDLVPRYSGVPDQDRCAEQLRCHLIQVAALVFQAVRVFLLRWFLQTELVRLSFLVEFVGGCRREFFESPLRLTCEVYGILLVDIFLGDRQPKAEIEEPHGP